MGWEEGAEAAMVATNRVGAQGTRERRSPHNLAVVVAAASATGIVGRRNLHPTLVRLSATSDGDSDDDG